MRGKVRINIATVIGAIVFILCLVNTFIFRFKLDSPNNFANEEKADNPEEFSRFHNLIRTREGDSGPDYPVGYLQKELNKVQSLATTQRTTNHAPYVWESLGPSNVAGRTRSLVVDSSDPSSDTWFAGTAGGGIWKTTNGGLQWINKTPDIPNLSTTTLVQSVSNPDVFYAGSGEGFAIGGSIKGSGLYKSVDHGETWTILTSTTGNYRFENVNRIIVDPNNENTILVCTNTRLTDPRFFSGILKSFDGGDTWTTVYEASSSIQQLIYHPSDFSVQYATQFGNTILKSTDSGDTWSQVGIGLVSSGRIEIAIAPENPSRLFATTEGKTIRSNWSELYVSDDSGLSWSLVKEVNDGENINWFGNQGFHNNSLIVNPFNQDEIIIGGIDLHKIQMEGGAATDSSRLLNVFEINTIPFLGFINWGGGNLGGGFDTGEGWFSAGGSSEYPKDLVNGDMTSIEIRFGPGQSQKAHRFIVDPTSGTFGNGGQGVPPEGHMYADYVEVPFEAWDIDNNRQLMVSFRDQERDGEFDLNEREDNDNQLLNVREYVFIHAVPYDDSAPDSNITVNGGYGYKNIYSMWPRLKRGSTWDPLNLPDSKIETVYGPLKVTYKSTTSLTTANGILSPTKVHPDHHGIVSIETGANTFKILNANDGGVYVSNNSSSPGVGDSQWTKVSGQMVTGQFYGVDKMPGEEMYAGGLQDNGVWFSDFNPSVSSPYRLVLGGDGGEVVWNHRKSNEVIISNQNNRLFLSEDSGNNWSELSGYADIGIDAPFVTRIGNSKVAPDLIYLVGASGVSRSADFGRTWSLSSISEQWIVGSISSTYNVEVSEADYTIIWAGGGMSSLVNMHVSTDGGTTFNQVSKYQERTLGAISGLATHPREPNTAYLLFSIARSPKILRTTDLGQTWTDISGFNQNESSSNGFPDVGVYSLFVNPIDPDVIWAGTEIGIIESEDNGVSWHMLDSNLPAASIWQIKAVDNKIVIATHGRGIWSTQVDGLTWPENIVVSIDDNLELKTAVYPNPASENVKVEFLSRFGEQYAIRLIDLQGRVVKYVARRAQNSQIVEEIQLEGLSNGLYILKVDAGGLTESTRLFVVH